MPVPLWKLNAVQVLALACFGAAMGVWLKKRIPLLDRLNIPASVVGGLMYALLALGMRDRVLNLEMDMTLRDVLMVGFFTSIGMGASLRLLRVGGVQVALFFGMATVGAVLQNVLGLGLAQMFGLDPLLGVVSGSVALTGGPATALAFGAEFEKMGVAGATALGVASATFGITAGGLLGGGIGASLIRRYKLQPVANARAGDGAEAIAYAGDPPLTPLPGPLADESEAEHSPLFRTVIVLSIAMGIGTLIGRVFAGWGLTLPAYVGAMIAAAAIRNFDDHFHWIGISQHLVDAVGDISLNIFIVMALLTLQLWSLVHLALPMVAILFAQVALVWLMCVTLSFRTMGKTYDSAVMAGGFCGFMLGTTANAMACMDVLTRKFGPAPRAYIVVPIVGAFLIDFTNALVITTITNMLR